MLRACLLGSLGVLELAAGACSPAPGGSEAPAGGPHAATVIGLRTGAFTPSGDTLYLTLRSPEGHYSAIGWTARAGTGWAPVRIATFSGRFNDFDPAISPDGRSLVFASLRPDQPASNRQQATADLWIVRRTASDDWSAPERLPAPINTDAHEITPSFGPDGRLYFASDRAGGAGSVDLYVAAVAGAGFGAPERLAAVNTDVVEMGPAVSPDGRWLLFTSMYRADELLAPGVPYNRGDLYVSGARANGWGPPRHLDPPINSAAVDCCAMWSRDGRTVLFSSERNFVTEGDSSTVLEPAVLAAGLARGDNLGRLYSLPAAAIVGAQAGARPERVDIALPAVSKSAAKGSCGVAPGWDVDRPPAELVGPGIVGTAYNEFGGTPTPNGDTLYFARSVPRSYGYVLLRSIRGASGWLAPERAPFSGRYRDFDVVFSPGGERMYFISDRPIGGTRQRGYQPWVLDRSAGGGAEPKPLGAPFGRFGFVWFLSETRDGEVFFNVQPRDSPARIYSVRRTATGYDEPRLLPPEVNLPNLAVREPFVAPDGSFLVFDAGAGDVSSLDLYVSFRTPAGGWEPARRLAAISSEARDYSPRVTSDGQWLYFTSERGAFTAERPGALTYDEVNRELRGCFNGLGNIYRVPVARLRAMAAATE